MSPAERETPAGEAMREAVAQWLENDLAYVSHNAWAMALKLLSAGPIASELARLTAERDEARADRDALEHRRRWNVMEGKNGSVLICQDLHAKHEPCEYDEFVPAARALAAEAALTTLRADHAAEVARLKWALETAADAVGRASAELRRESNHTAAEVALTAAKSARAALAPKETTDA